MNYKGKGIITAFSELKKTKKGVALQQIHFEQDSGRIIYPTAMGDKIDMLQDFKPGDVVELEFYVNGSRGTYNNVIIDNITRL